MAYTLQNFISQAVFLFSGIFFTLITVNFININLKYWNKTYNKQYKNKIK